MGKEPRPVGELMSIVRKVEWWSPRLATSLVLIIVIMVIGDYDDGDADDYDDAVVASRTGLSAILFLQTCRQVVDRYETH